MCVDKITCVHVHVVHNDSHLVNCSQSDEMDKAVQSLGITYSDENVNQLAQRHFENTQVSKCVIIFYTL